MWLIYMSHNLEFFNALSYDLTVNVDPVISTINFVKPLVAGPCTNDPLALNADP